MRWSLGRRHSPLSEQSGLRGSMSQSLEGLFKLVVDQHASSVQVLNRIDVSKINGTWKHSFIVTVNVNIGGAVQKFTFPIGEIVADHKFDEQKKEATPEYENFQRYMVSMFHRINTIDRRLELIKKTKLPSLIVEVQT